jgi:integrase
VLEKTKNPGIYLVRGKKGRVVYRLYVHVQIPDPVAPNGYRWKLKVKTFAKYQDAVDAKIKTSADVKSGKYIEPTDKTVKQLMEAWLEAGKTKGVVKRGRPWKIQTYLGFKGHLDNHIAPQLGDLKASILKKSAIELAGAKWQTEGKLSAETVNKIYGTMTAAFKWAIKDPDTFGIKTNPMDAVDRVANQITAEDLEALALGEIVDYGEDEPETKPGHLRKIQPDEVYSTLELKKIIEAASPGLEKVLLMTAILTGLRHGELNGLRWANLNLKRCVLTVNRSLTQLSKKQGGARLERPKTKNAFRRLDLAAPLVSVLKRWQIACPPNPNGLVFVNEPGEARSRKQNNDMLQAVAIRAGVRALSMNNLRHSFASQNLSADVPPLKVSEMMGHSDPSVTLKVYSRWAKTEKSDAHSRLASRILDAVDDTAAQAQNETV